MIHPSSEPGSSVLRAYLEQEGPTMVSTARRRVLLERSASVGLFVALALLMVGCNGKTRGQRSGDSGARADGGAANTGSGGRGGEGTVSGGHGGSDVGGAGGNTVTDAAVARCEACVQERCGSLLRACHGDAVCSAAFDSYVRCEGHVCLVALGAATALDGSSASPFAQCVLAQCSLGPCPGGNPI